MTTHRAVRRAAAASAAALLTLALAGCADDEPKAEDEPSGDTTSDAATDASGDEPEEGQTVDPDQFVDDVLGGMSDLTTAHMEMSMEGGRAEVAMEGDVDYTTSPPEMAMTMSGAMM